MLIGGEPRTAWLDGVLERDEGGYVLTCRDLMARYEPMRCLWPLREREPYPLETSLPGVFAIGDVRHNSVKRVASAVGEGAMAIAFVHEYLAEAASGIGAAGGREAVGQADGTRASGGEPSGHAPLQGPELDPPKAA